ncbi:WD repeat-containing protein, putative [Plasmodium ovale wallikeri]|uniref:WD repeat-containing protein, putative n=1 Tax=Plasmodium ovale wallikeri TaxID=864142 RepID=A0A1A8YWK4_PLAOA|nr:WD repeat-containing protein, putative [Plasmodium ovale wallikeri]SBT36442.1 WD repeat-containing protein, putative [Plasmodium ovale wallikeri]
MNVCKRLCVNHGVKAICILNNSLICISFGNVLKIVNIVNTNTVLELVISTSSNIYGLAYRKSSEKTGFLVAHGVHKIYFYLIHIKCQNRCGIKLVSKYCINKWILRAKFVHPHEITKHELTSALQTYDTKRRMIKRRKKKWENTVLLCLSNGSVVLLNMYKGLSTCKYKFIGIHLLYSADVYVKGKKNAYTVYVAGGTPFNKILLWTLKIKKKKITFDEGKKKRIIPVNYVQQLSGHRGIIFKVKFFKKCKYIGSVSDDREGRIWVREGKISKSHYKEIGGNERKVTYAMCRGGKKSIFFYYKIFKVLAGHDARVWDIDMGVLNKRVFFFTCSEDSNCNVYEKGKENNVYLSYSNNNGSSVRCICFHPHLGVIISGSDNGTVHVRSINSGMPYAEEKFLVAHPDESTSMVGKREELPAEEENRTHIDCVNGTCKVRSQVRSEVRGEIYALGNRTQSSLVSDTYSYKQVWAKEIVGTEDVLSFLVDQMSEILKKNNDWIRSVHHVNLYDVIVFTNFGRIYILKTRGKTVKIALIYEEEKKDYLLTCLTFFGLHYICLGFSNGFCCFLLVKGEKCIKEYAEKHPTAVALKYVKCFPHRVSEMCLIPLSKVSYGKIVSISGPKHRSKHVCGVLHVYVKKEAAENVKCENGRNSPKDHGEVPKTEPYFYQIVYSHDEKDNCKEDEGETIPVYDFLMLIFDHTGDVQLLSEQKTSNQIMISKVLKTDIDVKNKKSKIISVNYIMRQKKKKLHILVLVGDEYGCIFIMNINIPIEVKEDRIDYHLKETCVKSKEKLRVHNNRKVFDIKIVDGFIYSCGQNGNIIKYHLYKDAYNMYTLHRLCLIKVSYYSSIYKLLPVGSNDKEGYDIHGIRWTHEGNEMACIKSHYDPHRVFICCFKEKKFVLYDLKNKVEYLSVECGGFRRPLSIYMNTSKDFTKTVSFCFCKEKNIYFYFKKLHLSEYNGTYHTGKHTEQHHTLPYQQTYINGGFHTKTVSSVLWVNSRYILTCSEDGTIKMIHLERFSKDKKGRKATTKSKNKDRRVPCTNHCFSDDSCQCKKEKILVHGFQYEKKFTRKIYQNEKKRKKLCRRMNIVQTIYNHSEPIFYMCFLKNTLNLLNQLKIITSVGAKNSVHVFYIFIDTEKVPIVYHIEKLKVQNFSSNIRYLCVDGKYDILLNTTNKYIIRIDIFMGTSIGHMFHYSGVYEFVIYNNIIFSKIVQPARLLSSYIRNSTILSVALTNLFLRYRVSQCTSDGRKGEKQQGETQQWEKQQWEKQQGETQQWEKQQWETQQREKQQWETQQREKQQWEKQPGETQQGETQQWETQQKRINGNGGMELPLHTSHFAPPRASENGTELRNGRDHTSRIIGEHSFAFKNKREDGTRLNILCCGMNCGKIEFYNFDTKLTFLKRVKVHQSGINKLCTRAKGKFLHVYTCGDDQAINILVCKVCFASSGESERGEIEGGCHHSGDADRCYYDGDVYRSAGDRDRVILLIVQNANFPNAHISSIRSILSFSHFLLSVSWDQCICVWRLRNEKNGGIKLDRVERIKMAVYDVSCASAFVIRKKEHARNALVDASGEEDSELARNSISKLVRGRELTRFGVYLSVAGANGSLECFYLKLYRREGASSVLCSENAGAVACLSPARNS